MSELLPSLQAQRIRAGLIDYLTTTFALADAEPRQALTEFLEHPGDGIFRGPYVRLRLPFRTVDTGEESPLDWQPPFAPYRHQQDAYLRLTSKDQGAHKPRPQPTIVTTGTGSGKTEAFLNPIIDHVLRARRDGVTGMKALILYPMNALADDQANRLSELIGNDPALRNITAGLYTGDARDGQGQGRSQVTKDGLITNRAVLRDSPPDILLTNYKMLDQLLLRPEDASLWERSALSLTYLVLDEFHTYDGAQGTDVAMLLRRLGLRLRSYVPDDHPERELFDTRPLGKVTPVATSATLGDGSDTTEMLTFAAQVFGEEFPREAAITERRIDVEEYTEDARSACDAAGIRPQRLGSMLTADVRDIAELATKHEDDPDGLVAELAHMLWAPETIPAAGPDGQQLTPGTLLRAHDDIRELINKASDAARLAELAATLFGSGIPDDDAEVALATILAALSRLRLHDRHGVSVDITLWVREVTRLDRYASSEPGFRWADDGQPADDVTLALPAVYCRGCGRSGWGITLAPTGRDLTSSDAGIRTEHARGTGRFRALLHAPGEAALVAEKHAAEANPEEYAPNLRWLHLQRRTILTRAPAEDDPDLLEGRVLPVVMLDGDNEDTERRSKSDDCPSCGGRDQIRFLGSAIATLLSVSLSTLFGDSALDSREKRSLVFTDSVQDAAHRAGFIDTRSHTLSQRAALRGGLHEPMNLVEWTDEVLRRAEPDGFDRYRLVPRALADHDTFRPYWQQADPEQIPARSRTAMGRRLLFDVQLEVGLQSAYGRTLEATGSVAVHVHAGPEHRVLELARRAMDTDGQGPLDDSGPPDRDLLRWVHGTLEHMRRAGAIDHEWLHRYVKDDGRRVWIWGKRLRNQGAPAFPRGRSAPAFPVMGGNAQPKSEFVRVTSSRSWYARWTSKCLQVSPMHGAALAARLLAELAGRGTVTETNTNAGARAFGIPATAIQAMPLDDDDVSGQITRLVCDTCRSPVPTSPRIGALLDEGPCPTVVCQGHLRPAQRETESFYRQLFAGTDMRRVNAHEHTSLIDGAQRREIEDGFKRGTQNPGDPNVLVATPTLEMGIDIGDLTTVMLSSLPDSVAKYLQRVGRAGRMTGSSLALAYVTGRGDQLPRLGDPTSMINGAVRPPATYLDAEEILRRQFIAYVVDELVRTGQTPLPGKSGDVLKSAEAGHLLGDVIAQIHRHGQRLVDAFVSSFDDRDTAGLQALRDWALNDDEGPNADTITATIHRAVSGHHRDVEDLRRRQSQVIEAIPVLQERAELPAASDDDKTAWHSAIGTRKLLSKMLDELNNSPWISALEMRGLLPNYSLVDDSVELDAQVSWVDPDTENYVSDPLVIDRGSARALTEMAPGAHFYAHGLQLRVDGIEIDQDHTELAHHVICDACGYLETLGSPAASSPRVCPRCGSTGIADAGQRFDAVRLRRVFSEVRRDDAKINDNEDLRFSTRFEVLTSVDFDPACRVREWSVEQTGLGVAHYRRLPVRWFNLGRVSGAPSTRVLGGRDLAAPLFRVCEICGKLDTGAGTNSPREHRAWCPHRGALEEHTLEVGLARELVTQAVAVILPPSITADRYSVPSMQAALLLGMREIMGGSPDHLRVEVVPHPVGTADGKVRESLLVHDTVPGGTGYLTDFASAEQLWSVLVRAATLLEECPCQFEDRSACHRCLLPFTREPANVTRRDALRALRELLGAPDDQRCAALDPDGSTWKVADRPVHPGWGESPLEQRFRAAVAERLDGIATVRHVSGPGGDELQISAPHGREWRLRPQVDMHGTRPDFVLNANGGADTYAIYADGRRYHAIASKNRLADDAEKRAMLRNRGIRVLSVNWEDLSETMTPAWLDASVVANLMKTPQGAGVAQSAVHELQGGSLALLQGIIQEPSVTPRRTLANNLAVLLAKRPEAEIGTISDSKSLVTIASECLDDVVQQSDADGDSLITWRVPHLVFAARMRGISAIEAALILDDRAAAVQDAEHSAAWHEWLRLSNALSMSDIETTITVRSLVDTERGPTRATEPIAIELAGPWANVDLAGLESQLTTLVEALSKTGVKPAAVFDEIGDGIMTDLVWKDDQVAVLGTEASAEDADALRTAGWVVLRADTGTDVLVDEVRSALTGKGNA